MISISAGTRSKPRAFATETKVQGKQVDMNKAHQLFAVPAGFLRHGARCWGRGLTGEGEVHVRVSDNNELMYGYGDHVTARYL